MKKVSISALALILALGLALSFAACGEKPSGVSELTTAAAEPAATVFPLTIYAQRESFSTSDGATHERFTIQIPMEDGKYIQAIMPLPYSLSFQMVGEDTTDKSMLLDFRSDGSLWELPLHYEINYSTNEAAIRISRALVGEITAQFEEDLKLEKYDQWIVPTSLTVTQKGMELLSEYFLTAE